MFGVYVCARIASMTRCKVGLVVVWLLSFEICMAQKKVLPFPQSIAMQVIPSLTLGHHFIFMSYSELLLPGMSFRSSVSLSRRKAATACNRLRWRFNLY